MRLAKRAENQDDAAPTVVLTVEPLRVGVVDAARLIGVGRTRMYEHIKAGAIRTVKDGDRTLITMEELRGFVARSAGSEQQRQPQPPVESPNAA